MNGINHYLRACAILVVASTGAVLAADGKSTKLEVLLGDAQYALNRYEELDTANVCFELPKVLQKGCAQARRAITGEAEAGKVTLLRATKARNPRASDLMEISFILEEVAGRLEEMERDDNTHLTNQDANQDAKDNQYVEVSAKTEVLAAKLYGEAHKHVEALENRCPP